MRRIRLGRTGIEVSAVSLGTWAHGGALERDGGGVGWAGQDDADSKAALQRAYALGIDHWDTADVYGDGRAETLIGEVFAKIPRRAIFLATKVGWNQGGFARFYDPRMMRAHLDESLRNLKTDVIDLYYLHHCDFPSAMALDDALDVMQRGREQGKYRFLGLSDWDMKKIMRVIERVDPAVVQPYRNVVDDQWESSGLAAWVKAHDVGVAFFGPLKQGLLLGKYDAPSRFGAGDYRANIPAFADPAALAAARAGRAALERRFAGHPQPVIHGLVGALLADAPTACVLLGQRNPAQVEAAATVGAALTIQEAEWVREAYGSVRGGARV